MLLDAYISDKPVVVYDATESRTHVVRGLKKFGDITVVKMPLEIADYLVQTENIVAVGDGATDQIMIKNAGLGVAFNAKDLLKKVSDGSLSKDNIMGLLNILGQGE